MPCLTIFYPLQLVLHTWGNDSRLNEKSLSVECLNVFHFEYVYIVDARHLQRINVHPFQILGRRQETFDYFRTEINGGGIVSYECLLYMGICCFGRARKSFDKSLGPKIFLWYRCWAMQGIFLFTNLIPPIPGSPPFINGLSWGQNRTCFLWHLLMVFLRLPFLSRFLF